MDRILILLSFYLSTPSWQRKLPNFNATKSEVIIAGHCGLPFHQLQQDKL